MYALLTHGLCVRHEVRLLEDWAAAVFVGKGSAPAAAYAVAACQDTPSGCLFSGSHA